MSNHLLVYISSLNRPIVTKQAYLTAAKMFSASGLISHPLLAQLDAKMHFVLLGSSLGGNKQNQCDEPQIHTTFYYSIQVDACRNKLYNVVSYRFFTRPCHNFCCWHCSQAITQFSYVVPQTGWVEPGNKAQGGNNWNIPLITKSNQHTT